MEWNRFSMISTCVGLACCAPLMASKHPNYHAHQLELMLGVSGSSHSLSHLTTGTGLFTEIDSFDNTSNNTDFTWGVGYAYNILPWFAAYQHPKANDVLQHVLIGLDWIWLNSTDSGDVYQFNDPSQKNFTYDFEVQTSRIMLNAEVDFLSPWKKIFPFVQASIGGVRAVTHYSDKSIDPSVGGGITLDDRVNYNLAWSLGTGIKYLIIPSFQISASYLFTDFGLLKVQDDAITDRFFTNSGFVGFTYLFL